MESYKDIPPVLMTPDGKEVLFHAFISQAKEDAVKEYREIVATDIVNKAIELAKDVAGEGFVLNYITKVWVSRYSHEPEAIRELEGWLTQHKEMLKHRKVRGFAE